MLRSVFWKTVRDRRRALAWWAFGILAYVLFMDAFWPFVEEQQAQLQAVMDAFPPELLSIFGVADGQALFSPEGYLSSRSYGWVVPVVFAIYAAGMGARAIAGEEEDNTIDLLLSNPISRTRVVVEKWLAMVVVIGVLAAALLVAVLLGDALFGLGIGAGRYLAATLQAALLGLVFGSVALAAGALGARRGVALGIVSALAVAAFLVNSLGGLTDWLDTARRASPFFYYDSNRPLVRGLDAGNAAVLAVLGLTGLVVGVAGFRRRDVGV